MRRALLLPGLVAMTLAPGTPAHAASARLDLDIDPEEARVYLDGRFHGIADDFDGSPDYLWVSPGRHALELRHDRYHTLRIHFAVAPGERRGFDDELEETDGRPRQLIETGLPPPPAADSTTASPASSAPGEPAEPSADVAWLRFAVQPADAAVWLDGIFLGPADRFAGDADAARLLPGQHTIELTRPGFRGVVLEVSLRRREERVIRATLEPTAE